MALHADTLTYCSKGRTPKGHLCVQDAGYHCGIITYIFTKEMKARERRDKGIFSEHIKS